MHELLTMGVLTQQKGQIVLDGGFREVLQGEMCRTRADHKHSIVNLMHLYFPDLEIDRIASYAAFLESYILQN